MTDQQKNYLAECAQRYRSDLCDNVMPFWMKNGVDRVNGGIYTCVDRDGTLMDTTKSVWFQGRWGWTAAAAYNRVEKNAEWLEASKSAIDFIEQHCIDSDGHMFFTVTAEGAPVQKRRYVFSESFAAIAMAEYAKASGDMTYAEKALEVFRNMKRMLSTPGFLPAKTTVEGRGHSITMILINVAAVLKEVIQAPELDEQIDSSINDIERYLMMPPNSSSQPQAQAQSKIFKPMRVSRSSQLRRLASARINQAVSMQWPGLMVRPAQVSINSPSGPTSSSTVLYSSFIK